MVLSRREPYEFKRALKDLAKLVMARLGRVQALDALEQVQKGDVLTLAALL